MYRKTIGVSHVVHHVTYWVEKKYFGFFWFPHTEITKTEYFSPFCAESFVNHDIIHP